MKRIRRCKGEPGEALLEGPHLIQAALDAGLPVDTIMATPAFWDGPEAAALRRTLPHPPRLTAPEVLEELADADSPRGIVARTRLALYACATGIGSDSPLPLPATDGGAYVYLDRVQDPGNVGAIARVAEATGATALVLGPDCAHAEHPRSLRASAGSLLRLPVAPDTELSELTRYLGRLAPRVVALAPRGGSGLHAAAADLAGTLILILGSEGAGARPEILDAADLRLTIPMEPPVESLNVAVAAAVVLYERLRF